MHYLEKEYRALMCFVGAKRRAGLRFVLDTVLDGTWLWSVESPEDEYYDDRFWEVLGYDPRTKAPLASEWQEIIHPHDRELAFANAARHFEEPSHPYRQLVRFRHGVTGRTVWIDCYGTAIRNAKGEAIRLLGAHKDVTRIIEAHRELQGKPPMAAW